MNSLLIQPFGCKVDVFTNKKEAITTIREMFAKDISEDIEGCWGGLYRHIKDGVMYFSLYLPKKYDEETTWHEVLHLTWRLFQWFGVAIEADNHEIQARMQEYIVREIKRQVYKKKVKEPCDE